MKPTVATTRHRGLPVGLSARVELDGAGARLVLGGGLDLATKGQLDDALCHLLGGGMTSIVVDLRAVVFADCAGLRPLRRAAVVAAGAGGAVRVQHPTPPVRQVIRLTGLHDVLAVGAERM